MAEYKICPRCHGDGWEDEWEMIECSNCYGDGEVELFGSELGPVDTETSVVMVPGMSRS